MVLEDNWRLLTKLRTMTAHRTTELRHFSGDPLLTVAQAGEYLATGERFVRRLIAERRIGYVKVGKYVRLERSTLDAFVDAGRVHSQR
ncbi:excisionase family DNA-binding protein [Trujillonella endophytica]|uniref:DNA binding domain-containing protein, excisionase family n=1 Tax=Trujillonella endophytica TaxID=673521 RepID=A0A1H8R1T4_9ACTN|nr:excisionase family DNA-binding protein [Trujillella endophytica]SEO59873.1 DNA binding domain-containing protein, excisionase family [Trujillella endophytica]